MFPKFGILGFCLRKFVIMFRLFNLIVIHFCEFPGFGCLVTEKSVEASDFLGGQTGLLDQISVGMVI